MYNLHNAPSGTERIAGREQFFNTDVT